MSLVRGPRFELGTSRLSAECSSQLSYLRNGADDRIRTGDLVLTKDVLYLLSYISIGADGETRTPTGGDYPTRS